MARVLLDATVRTDYGQFDLLWSADIGFDGDFDRVFAGQANGLAGAASPGGLYLHLARRSGGSPVRIVAHASAPPAAADEWDDVVEVSVAVPPGSSPRWSTWAGEASGPLDLAPGEYRVRVSARGRDAGAAGELAEGPVDFYLVDLWPDPARPDEVLRSRSANAEFWHRQLGGRR
ncbi:hypothetical protein [Jiangella sp. DSM 45060]|uniref:hypothetical protein n=1 Tax=Jiangella sp. DSM 45060 TaxID=1798224 RepID=UPI000B849C3E|nr:hypothetical protein [Jiangella sp. DSM 45060]